MGQSVGNCRRMKTLVALLIVIPIVAGQSGSRVFFDITADGVPMGRIVFRLYDDTTPQMAQMDSATKDPSSTESFQISCYRVESSKGGMAREGSQFMEENLMTKTSSKNIPDLVSSPWPTPVPTPMGPSSSSPRL